MAGSCGIIGVQAGCRTRLPVDEILGTPAYFLRMGRGLAAPSGEAPGHVRPGVIRPAGPSVGAGPNPWPSSVANVPS